MKLSFSLNAKKPAAPSQKPPPKPSLFTAGDDDKDDEVLKPPVSVAYNVEASRAMQKRMAQEKAVDSTVYDYDAVWDRMQEAKEKQKAVKAVEALERKPKYIHNLLTSAATRKLDHLRAEEKMMQRERELEGDEFADKEKFVTQAYKDQMEEVRRAEEEEKRREEAEKKKYGSGTSGMAHFYRKLLNESEQQHEETLAASLGKRVYGPQAGPSSVAEDDAANLTITRPPEFTPKSDLELAKEAQAQGKDVELNDDNQIVDKRDLLAAGLNLSLPNTRNLALQRARAGASGGDEDRPQAAVHTAVGSAASRREINERRQREIRSQMEEEERRRKEKQQKDEDEALRRVVAKRNTEDDVMSARERYLARKRQRLEQPQPPEAES